MPLKQVGSISRNEGSVWSGIQTDSEITIIYYLLKGWSVRCEMPGQLAVKQGGQLVVKWGGQLVVKYTL